MTYMGTTGLPVFHTAADDEIKALRQQLAEANELREKAEREVERLMALQKDFYIDGWNDGNTESQYVKDPDVDWNEYKESRSYYEALNPPTADSEKADA